MKLKLNWASYIFTFCNWQQVTEPYLWGSINHTSKIATLGPSLGRESVSELCFMKIALTLVGRLDQRVKIFVGTGSSDATVKNMLWKPGGFPSEQRQPAESVSWRVGPYPLTAGGRGASGALGTSFRDSLSLDVSSSHLRALDLKWLLQWKKPIITRPQAYYLKKGNLHYV